MAIMPPGPRLTGALLVSSAVVVTVSAVLILAGLLVPLGVPGADATNFAGFLLWSAWIVWFGVLSLRGALRLPAAPAPGPTAQPLPA